MKYTEAMQQIQTSEAKKRAIARQLYLEASPETQRIRIRHTRKPAVMIAAAVAATLCIGTVTVGAATGWNYKALFNSYFAQKAEAPVSYDFTGMGSDHHEVFETDDYVVTLDGYIADAYSLYFYYDVQLKHDETIGETEMRGDRVFNATHPELQYFQHDSDEVLFPAATCETLGKDADGTVHFVERTMMPAGDTLEGVSVDICCPAVLSGFDEYDGDANDKRTVTLDAVYPTEMKQLETPVMLTVPQSNTEAAQNYAAVSPIGIYLAADAEHLADLNTGGNSFGATTLDNASVAVHYTDGTEETINVVRMNSAAANQNGDLTETVTLLSFRQPFSLDNVDYVTVNGSVIPVR